MERYKLKIVYENKFSGVRTFQVPRELESVLEDWYTHTGKDMAESVRSYRRNKAGFITFKGGVGYAVVDAELLGGNGDGLAEREFNNRYDAYITY